MTNLNQTLILMHQDSLSNIKKYIIKSKKKILISKCTY